MNVVLFLLRFRLPVLPSGLIQNILNYQQSPDNLLAAGRRQSDKLMIYKADLPVSPNIKGISIIGPVFLR